MWKVEAFTHTKIWISGFFLKVLKVELSHIPSQASPSAGHEGHEPLVCFGSHPLSLSLEWPGPLLGVGGPTREADGNPPSPANERLMESCECQRPSGLC